MNAIRNTTLVGLGPYKTHNGPNTNLTLAKTSASIGVTLWYEAKCYSVIFWSEDKNKKISQHWMHMYVQTDKIYQYF